MDSKHDNSSTYSGKPTTDQNRHQQLEPPPSSGSFSEIVTRLVMGRSMSKSAVQINTTDKIPDKIVTTHSFFPMPTAEIQASPSQASLPQALPKRACRAPLSRKFAHPCTCGQPNGFHKYHSATNNVSSGSLPPAAYTSPLHLYDPVSKKCLPTSRNRDMLLKDCHSHATHQFKPHYGAPCIYDDLICDARRFRCTCKPPLHLYYEANQSSFGCVPISLSGSPDGRINCRQGQIYNVISRECQKIFDINELPQNYTTGVSATQFSFVTIVLIWILLLILIVTAKLRKLRTSNIYRNSPSTDRRLHHGSSFRHQNQSSSAWLHPFIAAVNGHHHLNRRTSDRQAMPIDESGNYNDTDFFLNNGNRRLNDILSDNNFAGSQQSLNNPPPKFEEIYPSCPEERENIRPSNEDLPSYDEAMKLQNTMPPDPKD